MRPPALRFLRGEDRVIDRLLGVVAPTEVERQQLRDFVDTAAVHILERLSDSAVRGAAVSVEQAPISRFLGQPMTEDIRASLGGKALAKKFQPGQVAQMGLP